MDNNPIRHNDPNGNCTSCAVWQEVQQTASQSGPIAPEIEMAGGIVVGLAAIYDVLSYTPSAPEGMVRMYTSSGTYVYVQDPHTITTNTTTANTKQGPDIFTKAQGAQNNTKTPAQQRADKLSQKQRPGMDATKAGKDATKDLNKEKNGGTMKCDGCKTDVDPAEQSRSGVTPPNNEAHVDHVDPKANGGSGTPDNLQVLCRGCNLQKGSTPPPGPVRPATPPKYDW